MLIESTTPDNEYYIGRTYMDVPDMDGVVFVKNDSKGNLLNKFVECRILEAVEYDLIGEVTDQ